MLIQTDRGLYCPAGGFHVDPTGPVERALITHAHSDHARPGSEACLCASPGLGVLKHRIGRAKTRFQGLAYGEPLHLNGVRVSFHPAGHILGSAQIRMEHRGEVWVVSGDYKMGSDSTCEAFEPVRCDTFITESTFGLPVYRWPETAAVFGKIIRWWQANQRAGKTSVILAYALGKAQRLLSGLGGGIGPLLAHDAILELLPHYEVAGVRFPQVLPLNRVNLDLHGRRALVLTPPGPSHVWDGIQPDTCATALASGWMQVCNAGFRRGNRAGFVLSDHADWDGLLGAIRATGASRVLVTHGFTKPLARWLRDSAGLDARSLGEPLGGPQPEPIVQSPAGPSFPGGGGLGAPRSQPNWEAGIED